MTELEIPLKKLHKAQQKIIDEAKRFNVLCCGRRFGKTDLSINLAVKTALNGFPVGVWHPTYKDLSEVWRELKYILTEVTQRKDEQLKQIELITGGIIDFWSLEDPNSGRGRKYKRAIVDEYEKAPKASEAWNFTIRATLTDYEGDGWFFSTPKGVNRPFHKLFNNKDKYDDWMSWQMPTSLNPHIPAKEIEAAKSQLDPIIFAQEYEAKFTTTLNKPFMYSFTTDHINDNIGFNNKSTLYISFDFNVDPMTCIIAQHAIGYIYILDEIRLRDSNVYEVCDIINAKYGNYHKLVTGDASGMARNVVTKGNVNSYYIIVKELKLSESHIMIPKQNPPLNESRTLCNAIFHNHPDFKIHSRCKHLLEDLMFVQVNDKGEIDKTSDKHRSHLLDGLRYYLNSFHNDFIG